MLLEVLPVLEAGQALVEGAGHTLVVGGVEAVRIHFIDHFFSLRRELDRFRAFTLVLVVIDISCVFLKIKLFDLDRGLLSNLFMNNISIGIRHVGENHFLSLEQCICLLSLHTRLRLELLKIFHIGYSLLICIVNVLARIVLRFLIDATALALS